ncbi:MAG: type IV pilin N-terminal domain-containing protein [Euryarchaeota archaeon]|nr:type IV pilin N-terminal domain-containing protein [Euryarchaeota archaeon]
MNKNIRKEESAVSPVIGVILMVAITVILAAVIGAFVFGMGPSEKAPTVSLRLNDASGDAGTAANGSIKAAHDGGDTIDLSALKVQYRATGSDAWTPGGFWNLSKTDGADTGVKEVGDVWGIGGSASATALGAGTYDIQIIHIPSSKVISYQTGIIVK